MPNYHFSLGNSSKGPIGLCARVEADTPEQATEKLKEFLGDNEEVSIPRQSTREVGAVIEYVNVYINSDAVTVDDIDEVDLHEGCECAECGDTIESEDDGESTPQGSMHRACARAHEQEHPEEW